MKLENYLKENIADILELSAELRSDPKPEQASMIRELDSSLNEVSDLHEMEYHKLFHKFMKEYLETEIRVHESCAEKWKVESERIYKEYIAKIELLEKVLETYNRLRERYIEGGLDG